MAKKFSPGDDELLVKHVRQFPCLYDHESKGFKDFQIRENIWSQIGDILSKNSDDCKARWKNIRDNFSKHVRKSKQGSGPATRPTKWPLFQHLQFLEPVKSERGRIENCDDRNQNEETQGISSIFKNSEDSETQNRNETESEPKPPEFGDSNAKRSKLNGHASHILRSRRSTSSARAKLMHNLEGRSNECMRIVSQFANQKEDQDEVDLFMRSMALKMKKLPPNLISQAELQILTVINNLQASSEEC